MTNQEFSNEFDTLLNSYSKDTQFGKVDSFALDEYEKSQFLTTAQEQLVLEYYSGRNQYGESFEQSEEVRRYLSSLYKTEELKESDVSGLKKLDSKSKFYSLPKDLLFITLEEVLLEGSCSNEYINVQPITQDQYSKTINNPFRGPSKNRAIRLDYNSEIVELISSKEISKYLMKYVSKPEPIILEDLEGLTINGISNKTECNLHPSLHRSILNRAVRLALISKGIQLT